MGNKVKLLDQLLDGMERLPPSIKVETIRGGTPEMAEALADSDANRHRYANEGVDRAYADIQLIQSRQPRFMGLYGKHVLGGYSPAIDLRTERDLAGLCIPCFTQHPSDQPKPIRLLWAVSHMWQGPEAQFGRIVDEATELTGEDLNLFGYTLRKDFQWGLLASLVNYMSCGEQRVEPIDWETDCEGDPNWALLMEKERLWRTMLGANRRYQLMAHLISRKAAS